MIKPIGLHSNPILQLALFIGYVGNVFSIYFYLMHCFSDLVGFLIKIDVGKFSWKVAWKVFGNMLVMSGNKW
jgi:hypothetical protein